MTEISEDSLLGGMVRLVQPVEGYRVATDPVLLAAAVPDATQGRVLDVGTGTGAALLCVLRRLPAVTGVGLELLEDHAALARRSVALNGLEDRAAVVVGDAFARPTPVEPGSFDHVLTNPPYHGTGTRSPVDNRATAHMEAVAVADWIALCLKMTKPRGRLTLIHRADRLTEIMAGLEGKAGAVEVIPLWSKPGQPAKRVIVRARKGLRSPTVLHPGLTVHGPDGAFTPAAQAVLREGLSLDRAMLL